MKLLKDATMEERLKAALFYVQRGDLVFKYADPRVVLDDDEFIPGLIPAILAVIEGKDLSK